MLKLFLNKNLWPSKRSINKARKYIDDYWPVLYREHKETTDTLMGLPHPYIVPANQKGDFRFNEQYYWDSYFIAQGLIISGHNKIAENMLDNLFYMYKKLKMIPNASRLYMTSRSQPPVLTSYILLIYRANKKDSVWLKNAVSIAEDEYQNVWRGQSHPNWREVYKGLSRYYDASVLHDLAEAESGWDMTPRFSRRALDFLPIDLNCLLYKYERDFAEIAMILNDENSAKKWLKQAELRKKSVDELMWAEGRHFYFDYNYVENQKGSVWSLAAYYTLWCGMASTHQAKWLVKHLHKFNCSGGLSTTNRTMIDMNIFGSMKTQWAFPNGWAPLHFIVIEGLEKYGYKKEAKTITKKWLNTNLNWFAKNKVFLEKYNVEDRKKEPNPGVYPTQVGFGWTNGVFLYLAKKYNLI